MRIHILTAKERRVNYKKKGRKGDRDRWKEG